MLPSYLAERHFREQRSLFDSMEPMTFRTSHYVLRRQTEEVIERLIGT